METFKIERASNWVRQAGHLPSRVVLHRVLVARPGAEPYATHVQVSNPDGTRTSIWGHYDMSLEDADQDYAERLALLSGGGIAHNGKRV